MQLMQQSVQKSRRTTRPFRSSSFSGAAVFSQATPPSKLGRILTFSPARVSAGRVETNPKARIAIRTMPRVVRP